MPHLEPLPTLLVQIFVILGLARLLGMLAAKFKQPQVIGEIIAGILLGPTLLGWVLPDVSKTLFPPGLSMQVLNMVAQLGVIIFLFLVGLEFDPKILERRGKSAAAISISGIVLPFALGFTVTYFIADLFDDLHRQNLFPTALFMGAAMSVTAFPVLARIVTERNLQKTEEGGMAIAAAAIDDVLAWTMLAAVIAFIPGDDHKANPLMTISISVAYVMFMLLVVKPFLSRMESVYQRQNQLSAGVLAIILLTLLASAFATELIGIHALFGAFVAGFIMPKRSEFVHDITNKLESFTIIFLLPTFFAYAGLKADLRDILHWNMIGYTVLIIFLACLGKLGGGMLAARLTGMTNKESFTLGVLMNTRGLMELIILTVGLQLNVINRTVYGMMVVMALVTTAMAAPLLELLLPSRKKDKVPDKIFSVLIPVANPESGAAMLEMASYLTAQDKNSRICALHLTRPTETELYRSFAAEVLHPAQLEELEPLMAEAKERKINVDPMSFYSRDVPSDISRVVRQQSIDLLLMGYHVPVFGRALLGGVVHRVLTGTDCDVAVFVDRDFKHPQRIIVPFLGSTHDRLALDLAGRIAKSTNAAISIVHVSKSDSKNTAQEAVDRSFSDPTQKEKVGIKLVDDSSPIEAVLREATGNDLMVIGVSEEWGLESTLLGFRAERIAAECPSSLLIVRRFVANT